MTRSNKIVISQLKRYKAMTTQSGLIANFKSWISYLIVLFCSGFLGFRVSWSKLFINKKGLISKLLASMFQSIGNFKSSWISCFHSTFVFLSFNDFTSIQFFTSPYKGVGIEGTLLHFLLIFLLTPFLMNWPYCIFSHKEKHHRYICIMQYASI